MTEYFSQWQACSAVEHELDVRTMELVVSFGHGDQRTVEVVDDLVVLVTAEFHLGCHCHQSRIHPSHQCSQCSRQHQQQPLRTTTTTIIIIIMSVTVIIMSVTMQRFNAVILHDSFPPSLDLWPPIK